MHFIETPLPGVWIVEPEPAADHRGFFARIWCAEEFAAHGLSANLRQGGIAGNKARGTVRGLHFQEGPHGEAKLVRCTSGAILDVVVDLRPESPTFKKCFSTVLSADDRRQIHIPEGLAHGYQTLVDVTEVEYWMSHPYVPGSAAGIRWDDPELAIPWPLPVTAISQRDASLPRLSEYLIHVHELSH